MVRVDPSESVISEEVFWTLDFGISCVVQRVVQLLVYLRTVPKIPIFRTSSPTQPIIRKLNLRYGWPR
jgi:hypothetical protein